VQQRAVRPACHFFAALSAAPASGPCISFYTKFFQATSTGYQLLFTVSGYRALKTQPWTHDNDLFILENAPGRIFQGPKFEKLETVGKIDGDHEVCHREQRLATNSVSRQKPSCSRTHVCSNGAGGAPETDTFIVWRLLFVDDVPGSSRLLKEVNTDRLGRPVTEIIRKASWGSRRSAGGYENHVPSLNTSNHCRRRKGNGASRSSVRAKPGVGGAEWRIIRADKQRGIGKQAVNVRILLAKINHHVTVFRTICARGIVCSAGTRGDKKFSTVQTIRGRKNWNRPDALPVVGCQRSLQCGAGLGCRRVVSESRGQCSDIVGFLRSIERRKQKSVVFGVDDGTDIQRRIQLGETEYSGTTTESAEGTAGDATKVATRQES